MGKGQTVIKLILHTENKLIACEYDSMDIDNVISDIHKHVFLKIHNPGMVSYIQEAITNDEGMIQLRDNSWVPQTSVKNAEMLKLRNIFRVVPADTEVSFIKTSTVLEVREMNNSEAKEFKTAIKDAMLQNSDLVIAKPNIKLVD